MGHLLGQLMVFIRSYIPNEGTDGKLLSQMVIELFSI